MEELMKLLTTQNFAMGLCVYLLVRFETSFKEMKAAIERNSRVLVMIAERVDADDAVKACLQNGNAVIPEKKE